MQAVFQITILVSSYEEAIAFYVSTLGFELLEDTRISDHRRWVVVSATGGCALVLALPENDAEAQVVGRQTAGRVAFFLGTDNIQRDYNDYLTKGVTFIQAPIVSEYGTVAIFTDPFGNKWDLIQHPPQHKFALLSGT